MFEAFLLKYPNDKRWTPDAMFRLAELYYEKSAEEYLDADEAYKKALDGPNPPDTPPPRVDYTKTINLYRRLLTEFPSYRLLDAAYYLLGFCLGEMGEEQQAKQALLALVCANKYKPLDPPVQLPKPDRKSGDGRRRGLLQGLCAGPQGVEVPPRGVDPRRRVPLRQPERAPDGDRGLPQGADLQGLALLRPRAVQAGLVVLPRQPLPRGRPRVRQPGQVRRRAHGGGPEGRLRPAARGDPVPRRQLRRARLGRRHAARLRSTASQRAIDVLQGAREGAPRARGLPAARRHLLRPDQVRRGDRRLQGAARQVAVLQRRAADPGPDRPRLREGSQPDRRRQGARDRSVASTSRAASGTSRTRATPRRSRSRTSWPRTPCSPRPPTSTPAPRLARRSGCENQRDTKKLDECKTDVPHRRRALREVPHRLPELEAQLRVLRLLRRRPLLLGAAAGAPSTRTRTCATRCWTTGTRRTPPSG